MIRLSRTDLGDAEVLVAGMGRVGRSAYRTVIDTYGDKVCGLDVNTKRVAALKLQNYNVVNGDAEDLDFWRTVVNSRPRLVMLSLAAHLDAMLAARWRKTVGYSGRIGAVTKYQEDRDALLAADVDAAYIYHEEVGVGFADHVEKQLSNKWGQRANAGPDCSAPQQAGRQVSPYPFPVVH